MPTKVVSLRIPEEIYCKLEEKAVNEGKQVGILVKEIVENHTKLHKTVQKSCIQHILNRLNIFKFIKMHRNASKSIEIDSKQQKDVKSSPNVSKSILNDSKQQQIIPKQVVVIPYSKFVNIESMNRGLEEIKNMIKELKGNQYMHFEGLEYSISHIMDDTCSIYRKIIMGRE